MKKILAVFLVCMLILACAAPLSVSAIKKEPGALKELFHVDFENGTPGVKPDVGPMMGAVSAVAENTSVRALVRVEAEEGNQFLHMYRPAESTGTAGIRTTCALDLTDYQTLHLSFNVKSLGAGASVLLYSDAGNSPLYKKLAADTPKKWTKVEVDFDFKTKTANVTVDGNANGTLDLKFGTPSTAQIRFQVEGMEVGTGVAYDDIIIGTHDEHIVIEDKILLGNNEVNWAAVKPENPLSDKSYVSNLKPNGPHIYVRDWDELKTKKDLTYETRQWYGSIKEEADDALAGDFFKPTLDQSGAPDITSARIARNRIQALAFMYNITGEKKYADRAYAEMVEYGKWPSWAGFSSTLIAAELSEGYACAYDWLYDVLTAEQKQTAIDILKKQSLPAFIYNYEGAFDWSFSTVQINWNPVCNGAAIMLATALAKEEPQLSEYLYEHALESIKLCLEPYAPQGGYPEGTMYWDFGTSFLLYTIDTLENAFVEGFEIPEEYQYWRAPGIAETADFPIYYSGPTGKFNYGDASSGHLHSDIFYWMANRFDKPYYAWHENALQAETGEYLEDYQAISALVWYDPDNAYVKPGDFPLDKFYYTSEKKVNGISMRSSWENPTALFAAMQGGYNQAGHQFHSLGTYIVEYMGKRFITLTGGGSYSLTYGQNEVYYRRSEAANMLVANPTMDYTQKPDGLAQVVKHGTSDNTAFGIMDMTDVHSHITYTDAGEQKQRITKALRGMMLTDNRRRIIVQDEVEVAHTTDFYWYANTDANITFSKDGKSAMLDMDGDRMLARIIEAPSDATFVVMPKKSVVDGVAHTNAEGPKLAIYMPKQSENFTVAVEYIALGKGEGVPAEHALVPLASWSANDNGMTAFAEAGSATVLKLDTPNAIANGAKTFVDTNNTDVVPFTQNGRTLVPVRFISESFGATVGWDDTTQAVTVDLQDTNIKLQIGSNEMIVNGKTVTLDVPAQTINSRTLIPLRALVEALGKHVHWDDRGLIIISDDAIEYSAEAIDKMIAELNVRVMADGKDLPFFTTDKTEYALDLPIGAEIPQISAVTIGGETVSVTQASGIGTNAMVTINGKMYKIKMQNDCFAGLSSIKDAGVAYDMKINIGNKKAPEYPTYIYVESLTDSTGFASYPERGAVDGVINDNLENRWAANGDGQWLQFDFGSVQTVYSMAFAGVTQTQRAYKFDVLASADGITWTTIHTGGAPATDDLMSIIKFAEPAQARFIKMIGHSSNKSTWNTYAEVRFYNSAEQQAEDISYWDVYFAKDETVTGKVGEKGQIYVRGKGLNGQTLENYDAIFTYHVGDESIATISPMGEIAFHKAGKTRITVTGKQNGMRIISGAFLVVE